MCERTLVAMTTTIHSTAIVEPGAVLGEGCTINAYAVIKRGTVLGAGVVVHPFAVVGDDPQDLHFDPGIDTGVRIGDRTVIREHVTVHRSTLPNTFTEVGSRCLLMVGCHVGHDCCVADDVMIANAVLLGGHVRVGHHAFLGGGAVIHQYCLVGESAMIGGGARIALDVPAFTLVTERDGLIGLNVVGIRRRGFSHAVLRELKAAFRTIYHEPGSMRDRARNALESGRFQEPAARQFLASFVHGTRGFARPRRVSKSEVETKDVRPIEEGV